MKPGFINQKLGKRNSRRAEIQRAKAQLKNVPGKSRSEPRLPRVAS
jgi:hypothetical protein